ncbi:RagB/SusD family nutrient uptake outer membrane protein [Rhodohalobacter sp.]|uniref:RagB/SusD family nutrient uptake outer membrane protein n=1 Tax=Rhodohalobacter sp. TaxID=1974210 RepID=UPI002ACEDD6C|nr:RagB/SusD family nutrient uptake outer membrane protein [Rhodohalobacter sp.]MDZ7756617.1 RagB/SusD family nutrient uptake outer membrane protein [Rhodohalobacter sp.]
MKKLILLTIAAFGFALLFTSCDDELATSPIDSIDANAAFQSVGDLVDGANGAYAAVSGANIYSINALMTDELRRASTNTGQGMQIFNHNIIPSDGTIGGAWANAYGAIDRANRVLAAAENIEAETAAEVELKDQVVGEMLALRAYQHFELYRIFVDYQEAGSGLAVPYMTESVIGQPARDTKADFFTQLLADISEAETLLTPLGYFSNLRLNIHAVQGLRARVALYQEDWPTAIDYATRVIDAVPLTPRSEYQNLWDDSLQGEVVFKLRRTGPSQELTERSGNDDIFFYLSNELSQLYNETDDIRFLSWYDREAADQVRVFKYNQFSEPFESPNVSQKNQADIKMIRTSEMYLIRAEAYAQPGAQQDLGAAADDINDLRAERFTTTVPASYTNSQDAIDDIYRERRLELALEGHRFYDLRRAELPIDRIPADIDGATNTSTAFVPADDRMIMHYPIPQAEIFANDNMVQNPGY